MASIAALAEYPGRVEKLFLNKEASANGVYALNLWALNVPITVMVDENVPFRRVGNSYNAWFAKIGNDGSIWGPIIEKAFSKLHGNYARIEFGDSISGVSVLNGSPYLRYFHNNIGKEDLWNIISKYDKEEHRGLLIANTPGESDSSTNRFGLVNNHSYSILRAVTLRNGQRLIKVRNPWAKESFTGDYSDSSPLMTQAVRNELNHQVGDDGAFYMSLEQYYE